MESTNEREGGESILKMKEWGIKNSRSPSVRVQYSWMKTSSNAMEIKITLGKLSKSQCLIAFALVLLVHQSQGKQFCLRVRVYPENNFSFERYSLVSIELPICNADVRTKRGSSPMMNFFFFRGS